MNNDVEMKKSLEELLSKVENLTQIIADDAKKLKTTFAKYDEYSPKLLDDIYDPYEPISNPPEKLFIGYTEDGTYYRNMLKHPHILINDCSYKATNCIEMMLTNLIMNNTKDDVQFYISTFSKTDLYFLDTVSSVKCLSVSFDETKEMLKDLVNECYKRTILLRESGYQSVKRYNQIEKDKHIPTIYLVIEELDKLNIYLDDEDEEKQLKKDIVNSLNEIMRFGKDLNIFFIVSAVKMTSDFAFIRANINYKIDLTGRHSATDGYNNFSIPYADPKEIYKILTDK